MVYNQWFFAFEEHKGYKLTVQHRTDFDYSHSLYMFLYFPELQFP